MNITLSFHCCCILLMCNLTSHNIEKSQLECHEQVRQTAIEDFTRTRLYGMDSVFHISQYDTVHRMELKKISEREYEWLSGKTYPEIIAVVITGYRNKLFLDTTINVSSQNNTIPSRCIELNGKLFFWYDKHYPLTNKTIKILDKYHLIWRGGPRNEEDQPFAIDDSIRETDYFFCRNNLSVYKSVITSKAIGYYDPPNILCKP